MYWKIKRRATGHFAPVMRGNGCNPVQLSERSDETNAVLRFRGFQI